MWVAALAALVLLQKVLPGARRVSRATGFALIVAGLYLVAEATP
jgi:predicted metal-binding membrane protein